MRRTRFGSAPPSDLVRHVERSSSRTEIFTPTRGLHRGDTPQDLAPGYTPDVSNWVLDGGFLTPRSGLSQWRGGASGISGPMLGAFRVSDLTGSQFLAIASNTTLGVFDPTTDSWRVLSSHTTQTTAPSGTSRQYWDAAYLYDAASDRNLVALTNHNDIPKIFSVEGSVTTYSNLTDFASIASKAKSVCAFDNRLVWFNCSTSSLDQPTRVLWSPRGLPRNYQLNDGAGFEDLLDMRGVGQRVLAEREGVLLFSDEEIWRGRKRGDAYVFDFYPITREMGCPYPKTIASTPLGVVFLGFDLELYLVQGDAATPIGPAEPDAASRIQSYLQDSIYQADRSWAVYDPAKLRYELYFPASDSADGFPTRALYYSPLENAFLPQSFPVELSAGVEFKDPGVPTIWDDETAFWDEIATSWNEQLSAGNGFAVHPFSSYGTSFRFESTQTTDNGSRITAYWTSHALNRGDQMRLDALTELWMEHRQVSASSLSVTFAGDYNFTDGDVRNMALRNGDYIRTLVPGYAVGAAPHFRIQVTDGGRPKIGRFQAKLSDAGLYDGAG